MFGTHEIEMTTRDSKGLAQTASKMMTAATIQIYNMVLGTPWHDHNAVSIMWPSRKWTYAKSTCVPSITTVSVAAFATIVQQEHLKVHAICFKYLPKPVKGGQAHLLAANITLPSESSDYADVFSKQKAQASRKHGPQHLGIEITSGANGSIEPVL